MQNDFSLGRTLHVSLRRAPRSEASPEGLCRRRHLRSVAAAHIRAAGLPGRFNLFMRPQIRLRKFDLFFCAFNLALMSLC
jgi:hypothetical protein